MWTSSPGIAQAIDWQTPHSLCSVEVEEGEQLDRQDSGSEVKSGEVGTQVVSIQGMLTPHGKQDSDSLDWPVLIEPSDETGVDAAPPEAPRSAFDQSLDDERDTLKESSAVVQPLEVPADHSPAQASDITDEGQVIAFSHLMHIPSLPALQFLSLLLPLLARLHMLHSVLCS